MPDRQTLRLLKVVAAMNNPQKLRELVGPEKAKKIQDEQRAVADCRRRAACNADLLNMRLD